MVKRVALRGQHCESCIKKYEGKVVLSEQQYKGSLKNCEDKELSAPLYTSITDSRNRIESILRVGALI